MAEKRLGPAEPPLDADGGVVMHVHLMAENDVEVLHHLCGAHYRAARKAGKLEGMSVKRDDECGGRCDNCPRPRAL